MPNADRNIIEDEARLAAIQLFCLEDRRAEPAFDRLTMMTCRLLKTPTSLVSIVDKDRQIFKSQVGLPEPYATQRETPLSHSFCQHTVATQAPLIIENAREHPLVYDNLAIDDLNVIAYAGIPLVTSDGLALGSLCAIDDKPRQWTPQEIETLHELAALVMTEIELRRELAERETITQAMSEQEHFIQRVLNTTPAGIFIYDLIKKRVTYANAGLEQLTGYTLSEIQQMNDVELIQLVYSGDARGQDLPQDFSTGEVQVYNLRLKHRSGEWRWVDFRRSIFAGEEDGTPIQILCIAQDITTLKDAENEMATMQLRQSQLQMMQDFTRNTSHELRTPLTIIQSSLDLLKRKPETLEKRVDLIEKQTRQLGQILDQFTDMMEISNTEQLSFQPQDLNQLLAQVIYLTCSRQGTLEAANRIQVEFYPETVCAKVDNVKLQIALTSLIENALIHDKEQTGITLEITKQGKNAIIKIIDNGPGIAPEDLPHIFEPFFKGNRARTTDGSRAGMGLVIAREIIKQHDGTISVESTPGIGTTFTVQLPLNV